MTRRRGYLLAWAVAYTVLGVWLVEGFGEDDVWQYHFAVTGMIALIAALTKKDWLDRIGFIAITMASVVRAVWYAYEVIMEFQVVGVFGFLLWGSIATAQVVVAGWPETAVEVQVHERGDSGRPD